MYHNSEGPTKDERRRTDDGRPRTADRRLHHAVRSLQFAIRNLPFVLRLSAFVIALLLTAGCSQNLTLQQMGNAPRYDPLEPSDFFADGQSARQQIPGTVARGHVQDDTLLFTGKIGNQPADVFPFAVTREVMVRGQERFDIYCAPCHGRTGGGNGMIVQRGFLAPPTFHQDRLRRAPAGQLYDVIANGFGAMPAYSDVVSVQDRWAIVAYIRALQLSQSTSIEDVPPDQRNQLGGK